MRVNGKRIPQTDSGFPEFEPLVEALCDGNDDAVERVCERFASYPYAQELGPIVRAVARATKRKVATVWGMFETDKNPLYAPAAPAVPTKKRLRVRDDEVEDIDDDDEYPADIFDDDDNYVLASSSAPPSPAKLNSISSSSSSSDEEAVAQPDMDRDTAIRAMHAIGSLLCGINQDDAQLRLHLTGLARRAADSAFPNVQAETHYGVSERARHLGIDMRGVSQSVVGKRALELFQQRYGGKLPAKRSVHEDSTGRTYMMNVYTDAQARHTLDRVLRGRLPMFGQ